ncbi:WhiB family transcriptional regulator [Nocardia sp. BMG51109]|uniref:WhiB family transcriptional regulator n=1 Tax=Nocardia sp. BMG51109 TaxID=1056816 RepID=UPI0004643A0A|nr:WhiB family transcriptional regulator [Nocardia sp. BMG51109]
MGGYRGARALVAELADARLSGAVCVGCAPFFDEVVPGESSEARIDRVTVAERLCSACPVRAACDAVAAELGREAVGVWAGRMCGEKGQGR